MDQLTPEARQARQRRNVALALGLVLFVGLVFAITIAQLRGG